MTTMKRKTGRGRWFFGEDILGKGDTGWTEQKNQIETQPATTQRKDVNYCRCSEILTSDPQSFGSMLTAFPSPHPEGQFGKNYTVHNFFKYENSFSVLQAKDRQ